MVLPTQLKANLKSHTHIYETRELSHQLNLLFLLFFGWKMLKCGHSNIKLPLIQMLLLWEAAVNTHPAWWPARSLARIYRSGCGWRSAPAPGTLRRQEKHVRKLGTFLSVGNKPGETSSASPSWSCYWWGFIFACWCLMLGFVELRRFLDVQYREQTLSDESHLISQPLKFLLRQTMNQ